MKNRKYSTNGMRHLLPSLAYKETKEFTGIRIYACECSATCVSINLELVLVTFLEKEKKKLFTVKT